MRDSLSEDEGTNIYGLLMLINEEMVGRINLQNSNKISVVFMHSGRNNKWLNAFISLFMNTKVLGREGRIGLSPEILAASTFLSYPTLYPTLKLKKWEGLGVELVNSYWKLTSHGKSGYISVLNYFVCLFVVFLLLLNLILRSSWGKHDVWVQLLEYLFSGTVNVFFVLTCLFSQFNTYKCS